jgi:hypothetical protein
MTNPARSTTLVICALLLSLVGCSTNSYLERSLRDKVTDLQIHRKGQAHFITTRDENLADSAVYSAEERQVQLEEFINKYKSDFGITSHDKLTFVRHGSEFDFEFAEKVMGGLPMLQYISGLRILEREQLGLFDLKSGTLRAAKISVTEPSSLKGVSIPKKTDTIQSLAIQFLQVQGIACSGITVLNEPAYSLAVEMAGFEARCTAKSNSQYLMRIRLLINAESGKVVLLSKEETDLLP